MDVDRRTFLKQFGVGAAVIVTSGVCGMPDIAGADPGRAPDGGYGGGPGRGRGYAYGYEHGRGPVFD